MSQGLACKRSGELAQAEEFFRRVVELHPEHSESLFLLGEIEALRQNNVDAAGLIRRSISIDDTQARRRFVLGCVLQGIGDADAAVDCYRRALELDPAHLAAHQNIGVLLQNRGETAQAHSHFRLATDISPGTADAWINLGYVLERQRKLDEACASYERALQIDASHVDARFNRSMVLLARGDYSAGFEDYEWRWPASGFPRPVFDQPEWDGGPLHGQTLFLFTEQGFGDAIHFARYATLAAECGARVIVRCQAELGTLLQGVPGVRAVIKPDEIPPRFDFHCSLLSLPRVLRTTIATIPASVPYVHPDPTLVRKWERRIENGRSALRVGLVWASHSMMPNAVSKSTTLHALAPLRHVEGVSFYSLQTGIEDGIVAAGPLPMRDFTSEIRDFADTAALITNLDLVITVDTAVAHLAGALGKPVWTMLQYAPDWRWYPHSPESKWYPSMRLYRQPSQGDWASVHEQIVDDLRAYSSHGMATSLT